MRAVVVRPTVTPVLVRTPRVNDSVVRRPFANSAEPLIAFGAFGPVKRYVNGGVPPSGHPDPRPASQPVPSAAVRLIPRCSGPMPSRRNTVVAGPPAAVAGAQSAGPASAGRPRAQLRAPMEATLARRLLLQPRDELLEAQLLEALADRVELAG